MTGQQERWQGLQDLYVIGKYVVKRMLQELKPQKAPGPDTISTRVLKELGEPLSKPLTEFFQHSIDSGVVPTQWKKALVTPIFKKGDKHCPANYRPVSLTAVCSKLCEHVIAKSIMNHLEENKLLCDNQHGFRKMRSCESQLIQFIDELAKVWWVEDKWTWQSWTFLKLLTWDHISVS